MESEQAIELEKTRLEEEANSKKMMESENVQK